MASVLLRSSVRRGSAYGHVFSAVAAAGPSGGKALAIRRAVSLPSSPLHRLLSSGVQGDQPPKSLNWKSWGAQGDQPHMSPRERKVIRVLEEIMATKSIPQNLMEEICVSAIEARIEAHCMELSWYFRYSLALVAGCIVGYSISKCVS